MCLRLFLESKVQLDKDIVRLNCNTGAHIRQMKMILYGTYLQHFHLSVHDVKVKRIEYSWEMVHVPYLSMLGEEEHQPPM